MSFFATLGYVSPLGVAPLARALASYGQPVVGTELEQFQLSPASLVLDTCDLVTDGSGASILRRLLTLELSPQFISSFRTESAALSCFRNLYTRRVQGLSGALKIRALEPVLFADPSSIFGEDLDTWWSAADFVPPAAWPARAGSAARALAQLNPARQLSPGLEPLLRNQPVVLCGPARGMQTPAAAALPQPFSGVFLGLLNNNADQTIIDGLVLSSARFGVDTGVVKFSTDGVAVLADNVPAIAAPTLIVGMADGVASELANNFDQDVTGPAGAGTPTGFTVGNDAAFGGGLDGSLADVVISRNHATAAQLEQLAAFGVGWYGIGLGP